MIDSKELIKQAYEIGNVLEDNFKPDDVQALRHVLDELETKYPSQMEGLRVNLGITDDWNTDFKRMWTQSRMSLPGKVVSTPLALVQRLFAGGKNGVLPDWGDHYLSGSNTVNLSSPDLAIASHELGHALDFNSYNLPRFQNKYLDTGRKMVEPVTNIGRDVYDLARVLPPVMLWQENEANAKSRRALRKILKDNPEALEHIFENRQRKLPAGFGSYLGSTAGRVAGWPINIALATTGVITNAPSVALSAAGGQVGYHLGERYGKKHSKKPELNDKQLHKKIKEYMSKDYDTTKEYPKYDPWHMTDEARAENEEKARKRKEKEEKKKQKKQKPEASYA